MTYVSKEQIRKARKANLYEFMVSHHPAQIKREGNGIRFVQHDSIFIKRGHSGYVRYSEHDETGNSVDFLVRYLGYTLPDAVLALNGCDAALVSNECDVALTQGIEAVTAEENAGRLVFPEKESFSYKRVYAYLTVTRGISPDIVTALIKAGLLYQDTPYGNAVFINSEHTYCEVRGTLSNVRYHRTYRPRGSASYWYFKSRNGEVQNAYVCESAIDAISLYELHRMNGLLKAPSLYCSIGGVANQRSIESIRSSGEYRVILAVDNDPAGDHCRTRNIHFDALIPALKDWNEVLKSLK